MSITVAVVGAAAHLLFMVNGSPVARVISAILLWPAYLLLGLTESVAGEFGFYGTLLNPFSRYTYSYALVGASFLYYMLLASPLGLSRVGTARQKLFTGVVGLHVALSIPAASVVNDLLDIGRSFAEFD